VLEYCEGWPDNKTWIDDILIDVQLALNDIGAYLENVRGSSDEGGTVKMKQRFEWVLSHQDKLRTKQEALSTCHQSLSSAIQLMQTVEMTGVAGGQNDGFIHELPSMPWVHADRRDVYRSPHSRQKFRTSQKNLSLPSIMVSNFEDNKVEGNQAPSSQHYMSNSVAVDSVNSTPAELPGSTPDDLPDPDNRDLYEGPPRGSRTSLDQVASLPAASGQNFDHEEPSGVFNKANTMPVLAKRYRPRAVLVRKGPTKHRSLPEQLPFLPQQPSLFNDLSDYIFPATQRDSYGSVASSTDYGSPTSVTSSPIVPPFAVWSGDTRSAASTAASDTAPSTPATTAIRSSASTDMSLLIKADSPTLPQEAVVQGVNAGLVPPKTDRSNSDQTVGRSEDANTSVSSLIQSDVSTQNVQLTPNASTVDLSASQTEEGANISEEQAAVGPAPSEEPASDSKSPVAYSPTAKEAIGGPVPIASEVAISKPLTLHEKRRRAHARRMQAAYGSE
jgi:hypothetical protein